MSVAQRVSRHNEHSVSLPRHRADSAQAGGARPPVLNAFTVDVEDYFHVSAFEKHIPREQWDRWESRVASNTHRALRILDRREVKATFFVLGWVAERYPRLIREICACGHEIACHGYWHRLIYEQTPDEFRSDLRRARDVLQEAADQPVIAYRAPSFSVTAASLWALEIMVEEGFRVDSSVFPIHHDRYGIPGAKPHLHRLDTPSGPLWEFPPAVSRFAGLNVPVGGGGYFRLFPLSWTLHCLRRINRKRGWPFVFYLHPWELDPDQPRVRVRSRLSRFRHYVNLRGNARKVDVLLQRFRFGRLSDVIAQQGPVREPGSCDTGQAIL
jgi:polysaccharide deacetylase family protein (PEP-CTERM system associated)